MQTDKKTDGATDATQTAQAAQALLCRTTVIAGADAREDRVGRLVALVKDLGHRGRFDLLTVLEPDKLLADRQLFTQVARDAALAIKLHHGEQIIVAHYGDPEPIVQALKERPEFRSGVAISGLNLSLGRTAVAAPPPSPSIAVTCMDFRQHDSDLPKRMRQAFDLPELPSVLATAGGAKELIDGLPRGRRVIARIKARDRARPVERIVLTCHTDCGAMGGDAAPAFCDGRGRPDPKRQLKVLQEHLRAAALSFRIAFPKARIETGIVRLKDGHIDEVQSFRL